MTLWLVAKDSQNISIQFLCRATIKRVREKFDKWNNNNNSSNNNNNNNNINNNNNDINKSDFKN